jgi:hypothetical protein
VLVGHSDIPASSKYEQMSCTSDQEDDIGAIRKENHSGGTATTTAGLQDKKYHRPVSQQLKLVTTKVRYMHISISNLDGVDSIK